MRRALLAAAVLLPLAVVAASATFTVSADEATGTPPQIYVGKTNCGSEVLHFHWDVSIGHPTSGEEVDTIHAASSSDCSNASPPTTDKISNVTSQGEIGTETLAAKDMILDADGGLPGGCDNTTRTSASPYTTYFCVQLKSSTVTGGTQVVSQNIPVNFALAPPTPPAAVGAAGGDKHLRVSWSAGTTSENISSYDVHVLGANDVLDPAKYSDRVTAQTNADVTQTDQGSSLQNDVEYKVQVIANDAYGNVS